MSQAMEQFFENGILPVVVIDDAAKAVPLARALLRGGIFAIEITLRTNDGVKAIGHIRHEVPEMYVGAGTVITLERAKQAVQAGAQFIISPGLNVPVIQWCQEQNIPVFPGVATPSEVEAALNLGLRELKFFPAEAAGGVPMLRAFASPYPMATFLPTGGIGLQNMMEYLALPNVLACGGSWLCPQKLLAEDRFDEIEQLTRQAVTTLHGFSITKLQFACGVTEEERDKMTVINEFSAFPLLQYEDAEEKGSIQITANNLSRAKAFFERRGFLCREEGRKGILTTQIADFSLFIKQKKV